MALTHRGLYEENITQQRSNQAETPTTTVTKLPVFFFAAGEKFAAENLQCRAIVSIEVFIVGALRVVGFKLL